MFKGERPPKPSNRINTRVNSAGGSTGKGKSAAAGRALVILKCEEARTRRAYRKRPDSNPEPDDWSNAENWRL